MTQPNPIVVQSSLAKQFMTILLGDLGVVGGLLLLIGPGLTLTLVCAFALCLTLVVLIVSAIGKGPRVVITPEGFTFRHLFGDRSRRWEDVSGAFAVVRLGLTRSVGYRLSAEYIARVGKKSKPRADGYDEFLGGAFRLTPDQLADLLNQHNQSSLRTRESKVPSEAGVATVPSLAAEAETGGNGKWTSRVTAGVLALLFGGTGLLMATEGKLDLASLVLMEALAFMFACYAIRGRKSLPYFLSGEIGPR
jgi:hypothetical protein